MQSTTRMRLLAVGIAALSSVAVLFAPESGGGRSSAVAAATNPSFPAVVELFQSQGCSSCPPANANLNAIADRPDVIALSFAVTYWDRLGWQDTFAKPAFTRRQWDYANAAHRGNVSTPQMIINGRSVLIGHRRDELDAQIRARSRDSGPAIRLENGRVAIGAENGARPALVWLVRYDPRVHQVAIRAGENGGRTLPHRNIVRSLDQLGRWTGVAASFAIPRSPDLAYRTAVIVQQERGGPIVAARKL